LRSSTNPPGGDSTVTPLPPLETRTTVPVCAQSPMTVLSASTEGSTTTAPLWVSPLGLTASATRRCRSSSMALAAAEAAGQRRQQRLLRRGRDGEHQHHQDAEDDRPGGGGQQHRATRERGARPGVLALTLSRPLVHEQRHPQV